MKDKNQMITFMETEMAFEKIQLFVQDKNKLDKYKECTST